MINSFIVFVVFVLTWHADIVGNCMMANLATLSPECGNWKTSDGQRQSEWKGWYPLSWVGCGVVKCALMLKLVGFWIKDINLVYLEGLF